jgi:hypothetical protein
VAPHARTDLLHVDIQGREADLIEACVELLHEKVAYLLVGIHSRPIEGCLFGALRRAGWRLEIKRPASLIPHDLSGSAAVDSVQGWRNPSLLPWPRPSGRCPCPKGRESYDPCSLLHHEPARWREGRVTTTAAGS